MNETLVFDISKLFGEKVGARDTYNFRGPVSFDDINVKSDISGKVEIMKIEEGFNVRIEKLEVDTELICHRCLEGYLEKVQIHEIDKVFYVRKPVIVEDINDIYLVDLKNKEIDLTELLRQEIILHFPVVYVCSKSCEGICPGCGKNRNKDKCECEIEESGNKPLAVLKNLLNQNHAQARNTQSKKRSS